MSDKQSTFFDTSDTWQDHWQGMPEYNNEKEQNQHKMHKTNQKTNKNERINNPNDTMTPSSIDWVYFSSIYITILFAVMVSFLCFGCELSDNGVNVAADNLPCAKNTCGKRN